MSENKPVIVTINGETMEFPHGTPLEEINAMLEELDISTVGKTPVERDGNIEYQSPRGENGL